MGPAGSGGPAILKVPPYLPVNAGVADGDEVGTILVGTGALVLGGALVVAIGALVVATGALVLGGALVVTTGAFVVTTGALVVDEVLVELQAGSNKAQINAIPRITKPSLLIFPLL